MMKNNVDFEKILFLYIYKNPKYFKNLKSEILFDVPELKTLGYLCKSFYEKYKEVPSQDQLKILIKDKKFSDKIDEPRLNLIFSHNLNQYDDEWVKETSEYWIIWKLFNKKLLDGLQYIKKTKVSPENVKNVINVVKNLIVEGGDYNFDDNLGLDFFDAESHIQHAYSKLPSNFNWVDRYSGGGYDLKTLVIYAGEQNIGKSIWLANDAVNFLQNGYDVALISCEMGDRKVIKRIGSNLLNIKMSEYDAKSRNTAYIQERLKALKNGAMPVGNLFIKEFPTAQATVLDIESYLKDLEDSKGIKLKVVILDYVNIILNYRNPNSDYTYMTIKQICQDLRGMAQRNNWLVITATQITRNGYDSTDISMKDIAESAGLSHTADLIYAIIQDTTMHINNEYWLKILKIRDGYGKNVKCKYNIDYEHMRLLETDEIQIGNIA